MGDGTVENPWIVGDTITLEARFASPDEAAYDPATIVLTATGPGDAHHVYTYNPGPQSKIERWGAGHYAHTFVPTAAGHLRFEWQAQGLHRQLVIDELEVWEAVEIMPVVAEEVAP